MKTTFILIFCFLSLKLYALDSERIKEYYTANLPPALSVPVDYKKLKVSNQSQFTSALRSINAQEKIAILIEPGNYQVVETVLINSNNIMLIGLGQSPYETQLIGKGMISSSTVDNMFRVNADHFFMSNLLLKNVGNHLVQIAGELSSSFHHFQRVVFQDAYEQLLKVSGDKNNREKFSQKSVVEYCVFEYTDGVGPNFYIGGIDAHVSRQWLIQDNIFNNIYPTSEKYCNEWKQLNQIMIKQASSKNN